MRATVLKTITKKLNSHAEAHGKQSLAEAIGIGLPTLNSLLADDWERIERDTIERVCDYLSCDLNDFLQLQKSNFWEPFTNLRDFTIVRGAIYDAKGRKSFLDEDAKSLVASFCHGKLQCIGGFEELKTEKATIDFVRNNNCVIIGVHFSNVAAEVVLSRLFGAKPNDDSVENRKNIPFRFVGKEHGAKSSFVNPPRRSSNNRGIEITEAKLFLNHDRWPEKEFLEAKDLSGHDAAIIVVANKPFDASKDVKTIVLAGFTHISTFAAAKALIRDSRDLEPVTSGSIVIGALDVAFRKTSEGDTRQITHFEWKYLRGGRRIIPYSSGKARGRSA